MKIFKSFFFLHLMNFHENLFFFYIWYGLHLVHTMKQYSMPFKDRLFQRQHLTRVFYLRTALRRRQWFRLATRHPKIRGASIFFYFGRSGNGAYLSQLKTNIPNRNISFHHLLTLLVEFPRIVAEENY